MAKEAGRDLASVPVTIWGAKEDEDLLKRDRDAGVVRIVVSLELAKADTILPELDRWAKLLRDGGLDGTAQHLALELLHLGQHRVDGACRRSRSRGCRPPCRAAPACRRRSPPACPRTAAARRRRPWPAPARHSAVQRKARPTALGIAPGLRRHLAQARDLGLEARQAVERVGRVGADRIPGIAEARGAAQRRPALAADPDRRMRLLHRLGREVDVVEAHVLAGEPRLVLGPQLEEGLDVFVGDLAARGRNRARRSPRTPPSSSRRRCPRSAARPTARRW